MSSAREGKQSFQSAIDGEKEMSPGELAFLTMVIVAMSVFAIAIAYASFVASGNSPHEARPTPKVRNKARPSSGKNLSTSISKGEVFGGAFDG
jgi:hypothetical protein